MKENMKEILPVIRSHVVIDFMDDIKEYLKLNNITRRKLAIESSINEGLLSRMFSKGGNFTVDTIITLAAALDFKVALVLYKNHNYVSGKTFRESFEKCNNSLDLNKNM